MEWKIILFMIFFAVVFSGCVSEESQKQMDDQKPSTTLKATIKDTTTSIKSTTFTTIGKENMKEEPKDHYDDHMGCQEGEIREDGTCAIADEKNADLFEMNFGGKVVTEELAGEQIGFIAKPASEGKYPGIIMIHEWWGLNDNIKYMAKLLANEGYVVYAVSLYDGDVATESVRARELASSVRTNPQKAINTMKKAVDYLREKENVGKVGSIGWCFGGQQSLQLSLNEKLDATVIYYGQLNTDEDSLEVIESPVLGVFGEKDSGIPLATVNDFQKSLNNLGIENDINIYPDVGHAFANPSGSNYAKEETLDAWEKTKAFFKINLQQKMIDEKENMGESMPVQYAKSDVESHSTKQSCWTIVDGKVYDVTEFISKHKGGSSNIIQLCGINGTSLFRGKHGMSKDMVIDAYYIGDLA